LLFSAGHLDDPIVMVELDTSNGVMFPMYDPDANLVYLCGKVDLNSPFKLKKSLQLNLFLENAAPYSTTRVV
jgi:hypothetical protein